MRALDRQETVKQLCEMLSGLLKTDGSQVSGLCDLWNQLTDTEATVSPDYGITIAAPEMLAKILEYAAPHFFQDMLPGRLAEVWATLATMPAFAFEGIVTGDHEPECDLLLPFMSSKADYLEQHGLSEATEKVE